MIYNSHHKSSLRFRSTETLRFSTEHLDTLDNFDYQLHLSSYKRTVCQIQISIN